MQVVVKETGILIWSTNVPLVSVISFAEFLFLNYEKKWILLLLLLPLYTILFLIQRGEHFLLVKISRDFQIFFRDYWDQSFHGMPYLVALFPYIVIA